MNGIKSCKRNNYGHFFVRTPLLWLTGRYGQAGMDRQAGRYNTHSADHILNILLGLFLFKLSAIKPGRRKNAGKILILTKTILRLVDINNHILP